MSWFSKLFSVEETRVSCLVICLLVFSGFAIYQYQINKDISDNLLTLIGWLIAGVAGINGFSALAEITSAIKNKNSSNNV